jgi:hypothetical protein
VRRAAVCTILLMFPLAAADVHRGVDRDHGVRFKLDGRVLTADAFTKAARRAVFGKRIDAICVTAFTFRRDISAHVKWCLLEDGGRDVAAVDFAPPPG